MTIQAARYAMTARTNGGRAIGDRTIRPSSLRFPQVALVELRRRITETWWADQETVADRSQGVLVHLRLTELATGESI